MKLDRLNEYVLATTVLVVGIVVAIACGRFAGSGENFWIWSIAAGVVYVVTCLTMRMQVWLLIPMFWSCAGQLNSVPLHLPLRDLVVGGVLLYFLTLKAFKVARSKATYGWLDAVMFVNVIYIIFVYMRYPIGVNALGSDMVGGRAYAEVAFAFAGYWILNQVSMPAAMAKIFPLLLCAVGTFFAVVDTITYLFPATVPILGKLYSGIDAESFKRELSDQEADVSEGDLRTEFLANVGGTIINLMSSYFSPLTFINPMYIWRFLGILIALIFCLKSGHRITVPAVVFTILMATYFRKGFAAVVIMVLIGIPPLLLIIAGQGRLYNLPESAQRTLCFLPGEWDPGVKLNAQGSTEWRLQMWDIMLHDDKYIQDKVFGDGFGFSREDMIRVALDDSQDNFMAANMPHSGPVSTIRVAGFAGLGLFLILLFACSVRSWRLIRATKGGPFYPVSLFVGIQTIYSSFGFVVIFGDFKNDLPNMILNVGILNLLQKSFDEYRKSIEDAPLPPKPVKAVRPLAPMPAPALH